MEYEWAGFDGKTVNEAGTWGAELWNELSGILTVIFLVVGAAASAYAVFLGFKLAKAENESKRKEAKDRIIKTFASVFIIVFLVSMASSGLIDSVLGGTTNRSFYYMSPGWALTDEVGGGGMPVEFFRNGTALNFAEENVELRCADSRVSINGDKISASAPGDYTIQVYKDGEHLFDYKFTVASKPPPPRPPESTVVIPPVVNGAKPVDEQPPPVTAGGNNDLTHNSNTDIVDAWLKSYGDNWHFEDWPWPSGFGAGNDAAGGYKWMGMMKKAPYSAKTLTVADLELWAKVLEMEQRTNAKYQYGPIPNAPSTGYNNAFAGQLGVAQCSLKLWARHGNYKTLTGHLTSGYYAGKQSAASFDTYQQYVNAQTRRAIKAAVYGWDPVYGFADWSTYGSGLDNGHSRATPYGKINFGASKANVGNSFVGLNGGYSASKTVDQREAWWPAL